jgi:hypothetical protein
MKPKGYDKLGGCEGNIMFYKIRVIHGPRIKHKNNPSCKIILIKLIPTEKSNVSWFNKIKTLSLSSTKLEHKNRYEDISNAIKNWKVYPQTVRNMRVIGVSYLDKRQNRIRLHIKTDRTFKKHIS